MKKILTYLCVMSLFLASGAVAEEKSADKKVEKPKPVETHGHQGGKAGKAGRPTKDRSE